MIKRGKNFKSKKETDKMNDAELIEHLAGICANEYGLDQEEAERRVVNLISSGILWRFKENSEEAAIFTDHFLMIPSELYAKYNRKDKHLIN